VGVSAERSKNHATDPARRRTRAGDLPNETYLNSAAGITLREPSGVSTGKASTMDFSRLSRGLAIGIALLALSACAIYQPAPGPLPYSYAPRPVYSSPFLGFGFGFL